VPLPIIGLPEAATLLQVSQLGGEQRHARVSDIFVYFSPFVIENFYITVFLIFNDPTLKGAARSEAKIIIFNNSI
jgi:hypothetical protein